tara:strand:+ start:38144 stop:39157 length:1014 start_codon:yes stop_codon:yes gene_type:complete
MGFSVERNSYVSVQKLGKELAQDLVANGYTLIAANGSDSSPVPSDGTTHYVFAPTTDVDPVGQDWRLVLEATDADGGFIRFWACHVTQLSDTYTVAANGTSSQSGHLFLDNEVGEPNSKFMSRTDSNWSCFNIGGVDPRAIPISYRLSISDHGISFFLWAESFDKAGDCFSWFTIQRPVQKDGTVVTTGKSPLFCVFATAGGGSTNIADSEDINAVESAILKFVVYETDVNAPTRPESAVKVGPDSRAIINPLQQVSLSEDNNYTIRFPQGINTQRYDYSYELDMIAYTSADVISQNQAIDVPLYGEDEPRQYIGMQANFPRNTGMRMFCLIKGAGI